MTDDLDLRKVIAELSATRDAYARIIDAIDAADAASMSGKQRQRAREARQKPSCIWN